MKLKTKADLKIGDYVKVITSKEDGDKCDHFLQKQIVTISVICRYYDIEVEGISINLGPNGLPKISYQILEPSDYEVIQPIYNIAKASNKTVPNPDYWPDSKFQKDEFVRIVNNDDNDVYHYAIIGTIGRIALRDDRRSGYYVIDCLIQVIQGEIMAYQTINETCLKKLRF